MCYEVALSYSIDALTAYNVHLYGIGVLTQPTVILYMQALDGKVERDENGKEIRHPVLLTAQEKLIARKVCLAFKVITTTVIVNSCSPSTCHLLLQ